MTTSAPMLLVYSSDESKGQANEQAFIPRLSTLIKGRRVLPFSKDDFLVSDLTRSCEGRGITQIITTDENFLKKLLPPGRNKKAKLSNYAGSIIPVDREREGSDWKGEVLVLDPLKQLITVPYGPWVTERYLTKFTEPEKWRKTSKFNWDVCDTASKFAHYYHCAKKAFLSSIDIETLPPNIIRCVGYTLFFLDGTSLSFVIPLKSTEAVEWMRALNAEPNSFKVCQNGKYEAAHFFAYSAPMVRYIADTKNGLHSWMAELPKDLAFVASLFIRNSMYWKDIGDTGEELDLYKYNAIDTWATGEAWLSWLAEAPDWAVRNYQMEFLQVPISNMMEMRGIKRDMKKLEEVSTAGAIELDGMLDD